jgi:DHA2 family multidrug resistance protein
MFSLMRNIGSSIGISIMVTLLDRNIQINHAILGEAANAFNMGLQWLGSDALWNLGTAAGRAALDSEINRQASTIGYINDFKLMMYITLAAAPLVLLLGDRKRKPASASDMVLE